MSTETFNFSNFTALVVDGDNYALTLVGRILNSFGISNQTIVRTGQAAQVLFDEEKRFDMVLCEAVLSDMLGAQLVEWIRRKSDPAVKFVPIVVLTGHTQIENILAARDSGANGVVKKPIAPGSLFDRLAWAAKGARPFVETDSYIGPDRRFKNMGPPNGVGRRATDLSATVGQANEPNLSQSEIDSFVRPMKVNFE
jgi:CheY-like chemotaxis protein